MSQKEPLIRTDLLLKNKEFAGYQKDFARAVLTEPAYTKSGARRALDKAMERKEKR